MKIKKTVDSLINDESLIKSSHQKLTQDRGEYQPQTLQKILPRKVFQNKSQFLGTKLFMSF